MRILISRFRSGAELLDRYLPELPHGGLFYPTRQAIEPGEPVVIDVRMPQVKDYLLVRGKVSWRRRGRRSQNIRAGLGIEFLPNEASKRDYLLEVARGKSEPVAQRRHRRLPTDIQVDWRVPGGSDRHLSQVGDIGAGGAFIRTQNLVPEGTPVVIELVPPGATAPQAIEARVAWSRRTPGNEGVGVEFRCRDIGGMRRLRELVRRIEAQA